MAAKNFNQKKYGVTKKPGMMAIRGAKGTVGAKMGTGAKKVASTPQSSLETPEAFEKFRRSAGGTPPATTPDGQMSESIPGVGGVTPGSVNRRLGISPASMQLGNPALMRPSAALKTNTPNVLGVAPGSFTAPLSRIQEIMKQKSR